MAVRVSRHHDYDNILSRRIQTGGDGTDIYIYISTAASKPRILIAADTGRVERMRRRYSYSVFGLCMGDSMDLKGLPSLD